MFFLSLTMDFIFKLSKRMFKPLEHKFKGLELMFKGLKHKIDSSAGKNMSAGRYFSPY